MDYITIQKNVGHTPRKLRLVADMVRKMKPEDALEILKFANKAAALDLSKAIKTALANSSNQEGLEFKKIEVNEGLKMKRYRFGTAGPGRGRRYKKRLSHIKIVLTDEISNDKLQISNKKVKEKGVEQKKAGLDDLAVKLSKSEKDMSKSV